MFDTRKHQVLRIAKLGAIIFILQINILANLPREEFAAMRSCIVEMVLATDIRRHFEYLAKFNQVTTFRRILTSAQNYLLVRRQIATNLRDDQWKIFDVLLTDGANGRAGIRTRSALNHHLQYAVEVRGHIESRQRVGAV